MLSIDDSLYDLALSFAPENTQYVYDVASVLRAYGVRLFFDEDPRIFIWGKDFHEAQDNIYLARSRHIAVFLSGYYVRRMWSQTDRKDLLLRVGKNPHDYLALATFEEADVGELSRGRNITDLRQVDAEAYAKSLLKFLASAPSLNSVKMPTQHVSKPKPEFADLARHILSSAYRVRDAIDNCRAPIVTSEEFRAHKVKDDEQFAIDKPILDNWEIYKDRAIPLRAALEELYEFQVRAEALFGTAGRVPLRKLSRVCGSLLLAIDTYHAARFQDSRLTESDGDSFFLRLRNILRGVSPSSCPNGKNVQDEDFQQQLDAAIAEIVIVYEPFASRT